MTTPAPSNGAICGEPTAAGTPCRLSPLAGAGGRCHQHANLPVSDGQRAAARERAVKHGYFDTGLLDDGERALFDQAFDGLTDPAALQRELAAYALVRAARVAKWEAEKGAPSPLAAEAFASLTRAVAKLPPPAAPDHACLDDATIARQVDALLRDPAFFLKRLPLPAQEAVRKALRDHGVLHDPA